MAKILNRALTIGGELVKISPAQSFFINAVRYNNVENIVECSAPSTPPSGAAGFAKGALWTNTAGSTGTTVYINEGTAVSASWAAISAGTGDITSVVAGAGLSGGATSGAATVTLGVGTVNVTAVANAVTSNTIGGVITSSTNNLGASTAETITLTNSTITANSRVFVIIADPGTGGSVIAISAKPASGSCEINVVNMNPISAMSSVYKVAFFVYN